MAMKSKVIVLYARPWSMPIEGTNQIRSGVSVHYLMTDTLAPVLVPEGEDPEEFGYQPCKQSISVDQAKALKVVPGLYDADFEIRASKGQNIMALSDLEFISDFSEKSKK